MSNHVRMETHWVGGELQVELADDYDQIKTMVLEGVNPDDSLSVWLTVYHHANPQAQQLIDAAFENNTQASYNDAPFDMITLRTALEVKARQQQLEAVLPDPANHPTKPRM